MQCHAASFEEGTTSPLKAFQRMLCLSGFAGTLVGSASHATYAVLAEAECSILWHHGRHHITVTRACVSALGRWRDLFWLKWGVILDTAHRRKVVSTDASNKGWGALSEGKPTFGRWSEKESCLHINFLEILAVCQACQFFLPEIWGHHMLVCSVSRSVVSWMNEWCSYIALYCVMMHRTSV